VSQRADDRRQNHRTALHFTVIWRGLSTGSTMTSSGAPADLAQRSWNCCAYGKPGAGANGIGLDLEDCKVKFQAA
jgi:hypothetical protein